MLKQLCWSNRYLSVNCIADKASNNFYDNYFHLEFTFSAFAFSALTLLVGWREGHPACKILEWWDAGVVVCLGRGADLHMAQLMPLALSPAPVNPDWSYLSGAGSPG